MIITAGGGDSYMEWGRDAPPRELLQARSKATQAATAGTVHCMK